MRANHITHALFVLLGVLVCGLLPQAQSNPTTYTYALNQTTLAAAVADATTKTVTITSAAAQAGSSFGAVAAGQAVFVDHELMTITAIASTTLTVTRDPYNPAPHANGAVVYIGPPSAFKTTDPPLGSCTASQNPAPWINVQNGNIWLCRSSAWVGGNAAAVYYNTSPKRVG